MNTQQRTAAHDCLRGAEDNTRTFPQIVGALMAVGFEGYLVDFRRAHATYYLPDGENVEFPTHRDDVPIAAGFDREQIQAAIREAQLQAPGYSYKGFCNKVKRAGCAGYMVSFSGRRALYFGRMAETHVEHFPQAA